MEPEAAALFTKEQELIRQSKDGKVNLVPFVPKSKFMVVDLGGKISACGLLEQSVETSLISWVCVQK